MNNNVMNSHLVSIIIVNYNGRQFLHNNLSSLYHQDFKDFEIILVDNGSRDGSIEFVRKNFTEVRLILNRENMGFAAANNQGIRVAEGKYIATLNNDTEVDNHWLECLVAAAQKSDAETGMWAPKILSLREPGLIDSVGGLLIYRDGIARGRGRREKDTGQYDREEEILFPSACSALYLKRMLDQTGLFDEDFFAYCEDTDLGLRARLLGWKAISVPSSVVYHYYSGTTGMYSETKAYLIERNHVMLALKNFPLSLFIMQPFFTFWRWLIQALNIMKGRGATSKYVNEVPLSRILNALLRAYKDAIRGMPAAWRKRREIQKNKKAVSTDIKGWFVTYGIPASKLVED